MQDFLRNNLKCFFFITTLILASVITYINKDYKNDDALIYYRYIENFINGHGMVYNVGERFNGLTSPFYIFLSVLFSSITKEVEITQLIFNGLLISFSGYLLFIIFEKKGLTSTGIIAGLMLVSSKYFYIVFGMESNLLILVTLFCLYYFNEKNFYLLSTFCALSILSRGESIFLILIIAIFILIYDRKFLNPRVIIFSLLIFFSILLMNYLFNYYYYGNFLPNTLSAKIAQGSSRLFGRFGAIKQADYLFIHIIGTNITYFIIITLGSIFGLIKSFKVKFIRILFLYVILVTLFYFIINVPNYHWYFSIHFLLLYILFSFGLNEMLIYLNSAKVKPLVGKITIGLMIIYFSFMQIITFRTLEDIKNNKDYEQIGLWLNKNTDISNSVACVEIGHIGWYSKRYVIDILGLVNPYNAGYIGKRDLFSWYNHYKPDFIVAHDPLWGYEESFKKLVENNLYQEDYRFSLKGYKILVKK